MQNNLLSLAVVGHTNTGKTSLLRTLLRDGAFGEVADAPSTTRHVERSAVSDGPDTLVYLYDTPGLEDAGGLLDWLESHTPSRSDGCNCSSTVRRRLRISIRKRRYCANYCKAIWRCMSWMRANRC